jgi:hypothetical protein
LDFFFDFDEFLELKEPNQNIKDFLGKKKYKDCINIKINWLMYSDNDLIYYENKTLKERFSTPILNDSTNFIIKSTVRGNLKVNYWKNMDNPHSSNNNYISCSSSGKIIDSKAFFNIPPDFNYAILKHYATKTIEEYCLKLKRGRSDVKIELNNNILKETFNNYFFQRNKKTKAKINYIKKIFNITLY